MSNLLIDNHEQNTADLELGQTSNYDDKYNPGRLYAIARTGKREELGITESLPFEGFDCWNHYEVSWLNAKGKPVIAIAEIIYDCNSPYLIESKSLKLYFNSLNNTPFESLKMVENIIKADLESCIKSNVTVHIKPLSSLQNQVISVNPSGICLDSLDIDCDTYQVEPGFLRINPGTVITETVYSNLLKSNCLVTNQPDWGSVQISYTGNPIDHAGLLRYLVSFRNHNEFHEQCIERIFMDILKVCQPNKLTIYGRYTRRGGLDINPYRTTDNINFISTLNTRLIRQ